MSCRAFARSNLVGAGRYAGAGIIRTPAQLSSAGLPTSSSGYELCACEVLARLEEVGSSVGGPALDRLASGRL